MLVVHGRLSVQILLKGYLMSLGEPLGGGNYLLLCGVFL